MADDRNSLDVKLARLETAFAAHKEATQQALNLQAKEYDRRLNELNGEAARILAVQNHSVTRELFDIKIAELEKAIRPILGTVAVVALIAAVVGAMLARWFVP